MFFVLVCEESESGLKVGGKFSELVWKVLTPVIKRQTKALTDGESGSNADANLALLGTVGRFYC